VVRGFSACGHPAILLSEFQSAFVEACHRAVSCGLSTFSCTDCTDAVENRSNKFWPCNKEISRGTNACTRTRHILRIKVSKNTGKSRSAFNQNVLFEPNLELGTLDRAGRTTLNRTLNFERAFPLNAAYEAARIKQALGIEALLEAAH
jgi:hypothetical protein